MNPAASRYLATGAALIVVGGISRATWKLIIASTEMDLVWLHSLLFIFLAPGFIFFAIFLSAAQREYYHQKKSKGFFAIAVTVLILTVYGSWAAGQSGDRAWVFVLIGMTTLANLASSILLIRQSLWEGLQSAAVFFIVNILLVFTLSGMARIEQSVAIQWVEQGLNTLSAACFALGSRQLSAGVLDAPSPVVRPVPVEVGERVG